MQCRLCGGDTKVLDTAKDNRYIYRRRTCISCDKKFYTIELQDDRDCVRNRLNKLRWGDRRKKS